MISPLGSASATLILTGVVLLSADVARAEEPVETGGLAGSFESLQDAARGRDLEQVAALHSRGAEMVNRLRATEGSAAQESFWQSLRLAEHGEVLRLKLLPVTETRQDRFAKVWLRWPAGRLRGYEPFVLVDGEWRWARVGRPDWFSWEDYDLSSPESAYRSLWRATQAHARDTAGIWEAIASEMKEGMTLAEYESLIRDRVRGLRGMPALLAAPWEAVAVEPIARDPRASGGSACRVWRSDKSGKLVE